MGIGISNLYPLTTSLGVACALRLAAVALRGGGVCEGLDDRCGLLAGVGGSMECFYFAFGTHDLYVTVDVQLPNGVDGPVARLRGK